MLQQNPVVLNLGCRLTRVVLYNGHKMVVVVVIQFYNNIHALFVQRRDVLDVGKHNIGHCNFKLLKSELRASCSALILFI